jgi:hypothetical protein
MLKLLKGNTKNLKGSILIFAKLSKDIWDNRYEIQAQYATTRELQDSVRIDMEYQIERKHNKFSIYCAHSSPEDIENTKDDVGYLGRFFYQDNKQLTERMLAERFGIETGNYFKEYAQQPTDEKIKYEQTIPSDTLFSFTLANWIIPMIEAKHNGDSTAFDLKVEDMRNFFHEKPYQSDINGIVDIIAGPYLNYEEVLNLYLSRMEALAKEEYEIASQIEKKLQNLPQFGK